jgi:hypothetical protein
MLVQNLDAEPMTDKPLEITPASEVYERARHNKLRRYPSPERGGDRLYPLASPSVTPAFRIAPKDTIFTIGSCFARNVESSMIDIGMTVTSRELDLGPIGESLGFAANFYNKYSVHSILNEIRWSLEPDTFPGEDIIYKMDNIGGFADLQLGMAKLEFPLEEVMAFRKRYLQVMSRVADADVIIITLGYVETWFDKHLGIYLNGSPPQPLVKAEPERFEFRVLSYNDILSGLNEIYTLLTRHRTKALKMQRAALDEFVLSHDGVGYFPSYEFVTLSNPSVAWSRGDYRHVSPDLVARIMSNVVQTYVEDAETSGDDDMTPEAVLSSMRMLARLEDYEKLVALSEKRPAAIEGNAEALALVGTAQVRQKKFSAAFDLFKQARELDPLKPNYLERLITLCRSLRRIDEARSMIKTHEKDFPDREDFRERITWI